MPNQILENMPVIGCDDDGPYLINPEMPADEQTVRYFFKRCQDAIESLERWYLVDLSEEHAELQSESSEWFGMSRYDVNIASNELRKKIQANYPRKVLRFWRVDWRVRNIMRAARFKPWFKLENLTWAETRQVLATVRKYNGNVDEINRQLSGLCIGR